MPFNKRRFAPKRRVVRKKRTHRPQLSATYTEMVDAGMVQSNKGYIASVSFDSIPQHTEYATLFRQYCIRKLQLIIVPEWNAFEGNQAAYNASPTLDLSGGLMNLALGGPIAPSYSQPRLVYNSVFTANTAEPANEIAVLAQNTAKIRSLGVNRILKINCTPVASLGQQNLNSILLESEAVSKRNQWLSTSGGANVLHKGVSMYCSQMNSGSTSPSDQRPIAHIFYKVTFSLRDPR